MVAILDMNDLTGNSACAIRFADPDSTKAKMAAGRYLAGRHLGKFKWPHLSNGPFDPFHVWF